MRATQNSRSAAKSALSTSPRSMSCMISRAEAMIIDLPKFKRKAVVQPAMASTSKAA